MKWHAEYVVCRALDRRFRVVCQREVNGVMSIGRLVFRVIKW